MKKLIIVVLFLLLMITACTKTNNGYTDFTLYRDNANEILDNYGYKKTELMAQLSTFEYMFDDGGNMDFGIIDDNEMYFDLYYNIKFDDPYKIPDKINIDFIVEILKQTTKLSISKADIVEFITNVDGKYDYQISAEYSNYFTVCKTKGTIETDKYLMYLEIYNDGSGFFEITGIIEKERSQFFNLSLAAQKCFEKYKYLDFKTRHGEVYKSDISEQAYLQLIMYSDLHDDINEVMYGKDIIIIFNSELQSAIEMNRYINIDMCVEMINLLSSNEIDRELLFDFLSDKTGKYFGESIDNEIIMNKIYEPKDFVEWRLIYTLKNNFIEEFSYHNYPVYDD